MLNKWNINVNVNGMPEKVASAFCDLTNAMVGAEYSPIAYLGTQQANGINHAILAEQVLVHGRDSHNVVVMILNERPEGFSIVGIERVVEGGMPMGGVHVQPMTDIPEDAAAAWNEAFSAYVGAEVLPFALLGTQPVCGGNYIFAATLKPVLPASEIKVVLVTINPASGTLTIADLLPNRHEASLGYAFTWLPGGLGKPLGEWP